MTDEVTQADRNDMAMIDILRELADGLDAERHHWRAREVRQVADRLEEMHAEIAKLKMKLAEAEGRASPFAFHKPL